MAVVDYYVNTDTGSSSGVGSIGDPWNRLSTGEAFLDTVDNSANDIIIHCSGSAADIVACYFASWSFTPLSITIVNDDSLEAVYSSSIYRLQITAGFSIAVRMGLSCPTTIDGLQVQNTGNGGSCIRCEGANVNIVKNNYVRGDPSDTTTDGIYLTSGVGTNHIVNNVIEDIPDIGIYLQGGGFFTGTANIYNNTVIDCGRGIVATSVSGAATFNVRSNTLNGNATDYTLDPDTDNFDNNIDEDGSGNITATVVFDDAAAGDYQTSDAVVVGEGTDLGALYALVTTDRLGVERGSSWDIGAFQNAGGGSVSLIVDDLSQSQTIDNVTISLDLDIQDISQSQQIDNTSLTDSLISNNIGQLQFIDNSILVVDLPVSDMVQQQQVENSVLGVSVISTDISQQQTIDNTSLDVSLSVSNIIQNELLENTSLVPSLLINSLSQMQVLGTSSVKVSLITSDISQGQIVNSSTLIQEYNLIINDVDQEQLVESTGSELRLFPVDINQLQVLDGSQIVQNHLLSVQNISQNQNIDSTLLTVSLSTGDLNQNQSTGNVVLGLDLVSDSISQQQLIDIVNLGFGLVTGNINQDQSVEGTSIVQSYSIQVDEISQSQILSNVRLGSIILAVMDGDIKIGTLFIANELKLSSLFNSSIKIY